MDEFASHTGISWNGHVGTVQYGGGDQRMVVMFYLRPIHNPAKSNEAGRPIYEDKVFVRIHPPGERLNIVDRLATDSDKRRWALQWQQFRQNMEQTAEGTPVNLLYPDQPSIAATLKANGVHTIEQCAELSGHAIDNIGMGAQRYANDAKKYLELSNKGVKGSQLRAELEERDREIHSLKHQIDIMQAELNHLRVAQGEQVTLETLQNMISGLQGKRPTNQVVDVQAAQIAANHPTRNIADTNRARRKRIQG